MPTYDYECDGCGHKFEAFQAMVDDVFTKCPKCKKKKLRRLFGAGAAVMFKGTGFYTTDYRSDSYKKSADADKKASSDAPASSSESKGGGENKGGGESKSAGPSPKPDKKG